MLTIVSIYPRMCNPCVKEGVRELKKQRKQRKLQVQRR